MEIRDIRQNSAYLEELIEMGSNATPTFVIGGEMLIGFDPSRVMELWNQHKD